MASHKTQLFFLLYINDLSGALGESAFRFADDMKMVFPGSQSSRLLSYLSFGWAVEWDLPINSTMCSCLIVGNLPPLSPSFFLLVDALQEGCEYIKTIAFHGPLVFHGNYLNTPDALSFPNHRILITLCGHCCPPRPILSLINNSYTILCIPQTSPHYVFLSILISHRLVFYNRQILSCPICLLDAAQ